MITNNICYDDETTLSPKNVPGSWSIRRSSVSRTSISPWNHFCVTSSRTASSHCRDGCSGDGENQSRHLCGKGGGGEL